VCCHAARWCVACRAQTCTRGLLRRVVSVVGFRVSDFGFRVQISGLLRRVKANGAKGMRKILDVWGLDDRWVSNGADPARAYVVPRVPGHFYSDDFFVGTPGELAEGALLALLLC